MLLGFLAILHFAADSIAVKSIDSAAPHTGAAHVPNTEVTIATVAPGEATSTFCGALGSEMDAAVAEYGAAKDKLAMGFTKECTVMLRTLLQRRP